MISDFVLLLVYYQKNNDEIKKKMVNLKLKNKDVIKYCINYLNVDEK